MRLTVCSIFLSLFFSFQIFAQTESVESIKIVSSWDGLGAPAESRLSIVRKKEKFYANGKKIKTELIDALVAALNFSGKETTPADFGITQAWLDANAKKALDKRTNLDTDVEREFFLKSFRDLKLIEKVLPGVFAGGWTDDYPHFEMEIEMTGGAKITVESGEQNILMIPWTVIKGAEKYSVSDPRLSRAIADLLPEKFTNRGRISDEGLAIVLGKKVYSEIENELKVIDSEAKIGGELALLKNRYEIRKTEFVYLSSVDVGSPGSKYLTKEYKKWQGPTWNAELHRKDLPENVIIGVNLPFENNKLPTFNIFLEKIDGIVEHVLGVRWLAKYIAENPDTKIEIRFVTDRSFSEKAQESFVENMTEGKAEDFPARFKDSLSDSVFLEINDKGSWSRWLVLPDRRMILWHYKAESVLGWDLSKAKSWERYGWNVTRFVVLPGGTIEP